MTARSAAANTSLIERQTTGRTAPLQPCEPLAGEVKQRYGNRENEIEQSQTPAITRWNFGWSHRVVAEEPGERLRRANQGHEQSEPVNQGNVEQIVEQRHAAEDREPVDPPAPGPLEQWEERNDRTQRHEQERQRRGIFVRGEKAERPLGVPGARIAIEVEGPEHQEEQHRSDTPSKAACAALCRTA